MNNKNKRLAWMDLEMTGLCPVNDRIIEIATIVTDFDLNIIAKGPNIIINQSDKLMNSMDEWCTKTHGKSGLTQAVYDSKITEKQAEHMTLEFLKKFLDPKMSPLCGNTIYQDRRFLFRHMPQLESFFHYRLLDVSSIKILADEWNPAAVFEKTGDSNHRALDDIKQSVAELKHYREHFFKIDEIEED